MLRPNKYGHQVANKNYQITDYESSNVGERSLAITHEQVSDSYVEGTIDGKIEKGNG